MDEVLKDFLWRCRVKLFADAGSNVSFLPRPPELIVLTALKDRTPPSDTLVYPDPPIGAEEMNLFASAAPGVKLLSAHLRALKDVTQYARRVLALKTCELSYRRRSEVPRLQDGTRGGLFP